MQIVAGDDAKPYFQQAQALLMANPRSLHLAHHASEPMGSDTNNSTDLQCVLAVRTSDRTVPAVLSMKRVFGRNLACYMIDELVVCSTWGTHALNTTMIAVSLITKARSMMFDHQGSRCCTR